MLAAEALLGLDGGGRLARMPILLLHESRLRQGDRSLEPGMNPSPLFQAVGPAVPERALSWHRRLSAMASNALTSWPQRAYEADVLEQRFLGRGILLVNAPGAIRHVLADKVENYRISPATVRLLRPSVGQGLFLSEGEAWEFQR